VITSVANVPPKFSKKTDDSCCNRLTGMILLLSSINCVKNEHCLHSSHSVFLILLLGSSPLLHYHTRRYLSTRRFTRKTTYCREMPPTLGRLLSLRQSNTIWNPTACIKTGFHCMATYWRPNLV